MEGTSDSNGVPSTGDPLPFSLLTSSGLCALFLPFAALFFAVSLHNPQPLAQVPQTRGILPGAVGEALSQSCHPLRVTMQSAHLSIPPHRAMRISRGNMHESCFD